MPEKQTYQYSRSPIGIPSVLLAVVWGGIWLLWPPLKPAADGARQERLPGAEVSYGPVQEVLYMSPVLFARSTRVGFRAPEGETDELALDSAERAGPRTRFLHVQPPEPDFVGMRLEHEQIVPGTKRVDGYRPVWKDEAVFTPAAMTNAVVVEVRGALRSREFHPADMAAPGEGKGIHNRQVTAFVALAPDGTVGDVFVEGSCGDPAVDAAVVRALEGGTAAPAEGPASGRVIVTIRSTR